jgi:DNA-directed RNA polymerase subunit RPC12/RpoP
MSGLLNDHTLPVSCPKCGARIQKTVSWLRDNNEIKCPCGTKMHLKTEEVLSAVESLETALSRVIRPAPEEAPAAG